MRRNAAFHPRVTRQYRSQQASQRPTSPPASARLRVADALGVAVDDFLDASVRQRDLAALRQAAGLDRGAAAVALGYSETTLRRVERGLMLPPDPVAMARLYRVTAAELAEAARNSGPP